MSFLLRLTSYCTSLLPSYVLASVIKPWHKIVVCTRAIKMKAYVKHSYAAIGLRVPGY